MAVLIVDDHAGVGCAGWVFRTILGEVAQVLEEGEQVALAGWLNDENSGPQVYGHLDVRELTPENQRAFRKALPVAFERSNDQGASAWADPSFWPGYIRLFEGLVDQIRAIEAGRAPKPPQNLNSIPDAGGPRAGPGWDDIEPTS